jgi:hypothetical protein
MGEYEHMNKITKAITKLLVLSGLLLLLPSLASAQTSLTQTTLAAAVNVGVAGGASGSNTGFYQTTVSLASATGITVAFNGQPVTYIYVDQELMGIVSLVTGQTTIFNVLRAQQGTKASAHASGQMVLVQTVTPQFGGGTGSGGFQPTDPPNNGACTAANTLFTPWVNIITAAQWICSPITTTWVPGFNNPLTIVSSKVTTAVASAAGQVTPSGPLFHITGALAITGFLQPVGCNTTAVGGCMFMVIPDGTFTWTAANNIAIAGTAVVNKTLMFVWDATNSKWVPSNLS